MTELYKESFMYKIIKRESRFEGKIFKVERQTLETIDNTIIREVVYKKPAAVILTINKTKETVILTKEYRAGSESIVHGFPAGIMDETDKNLKATAIREVKEETGYQTSYLEELGSGYTSPGFTNEKIYYFLAVVEGEPSQQKLDIDEEIEIVEVKFNQLLDYLKEDKIIDNNAYSCLMRYLFKNNSGVINKILNEIIKKY